MTIPVFIFMIAVMAKKQRCCVLAGVDWAGAKLVVSRHMAAIFSISSCIWLACTAAHVKLLLPCNLAHLLLCCLLCLPAAPQLYLTVTILAYAAPRWLHNWLSFYVNVSNAVFMWVSAQQLQQLLAHPAAGHQLCLCVRPSELALRHLPMHVACCSRTAYRDNKPYVSA
jgi:hypothetical protein